MNGLLNLNVGAKLLYFADDTVILLKEKNIECLDITAYLIFKMVKLWFDNNFLVLNLKKSTYKI